MKLEDFIKELQEVEKENPNFRVYIEDKEGCYFHNFEIVLDGTKGIVIRLD